MDENGNTVLSVDGMIAGKMPHGREMMPDNGPYDGQKKLRYSAKPGWVSPYVGDNLIEVFMTMIIYPPSEICKRNLKNFLFSKFQFFYLTNNYTPVCLGAGPRCSFAASRHASVGAW